MNIPTRILLIDAQAIFRCGVRMLLETQPGMRVVGEARTGEEGLARLTELGGVDVMITEIALPGIDGIKVAQCAKALETQIKVILLTFRADEEHLQRMIEVGADGYMMKQAAIAELIDAIHNVARGEVAQAPAVAGRLIDHFQIGREREHRAAPRRTWGRQFLAFIARRLTSKEIARQIDNSTASADDESGIAR